MKINDSVIISPHHSLKFANKRGVIKKICPNEELNIKVQFEGGEILYGFSAEEVSLASDNIN